MHGRVGRDGDDDHARFDQRQWTVLQFAAGIALGVQVRQFLQFQSTFERRRKTDVAADEEEVVRAHQFLRDELHALATIKHGLYLGTDRAETLEQSVDLGLGQRAAKLREPQRQ